MSTRQSPWLEQTYQMRRQRTVDLTRLSIAHLRSTQGRISLSSIVAASRLVDETGRGISSSAVLANQSAMELYVEARDWRPLKIQKKMRSKHPLELSLNLTRDAAAVRTRLRRLTKDELVERVLQLEKVLGELRQNLVQQHALAVAAHTSVR